MQKHSSLLISFLLITSLANAQTASKDDWISSMNTALPVLLCKADSYFVRCFKVSQIECEETAASATRICLKSVQDKFPNIFQQPRDGEHWGGKVGECVGNTYETVLAQKRISNDECNDVSRWLAK